MIPCALPPATPRRVMAALCLPYNGHLALKNGCFPPIYGITMPRICYIITQAGWNKTRNPCGTYSDPRDRDSAFKGLFEKTKFFWEIFGRNCFERNMHPEKQRYRGLFLHKIAGSKPRVS
jgi:hypothetical protein